MGRFRFGPRTTSGNSASLAGCGGRVAGVLFGLLFAGMGFIFVVLICREAWRAAQTRWWTPTPATVIESRVQADSASDKEPYRPVVRYRYRLTQGKQTDVVSDTFWNKGGGFADYAEAQAIVDRHPVGANVTAYVDPADPHRAVLEHRAAWIGLAVVLPLVFVLIGGVVVIGSIKATPAAADGTSISATRAISQKARFGRGWAAAFFGIFFLAGLGIGIPAVILPVWRNVSARSWPAVQCTIVSSTVRDHRGSETTTYRPDVLYRYTFNGREYRSNRYSAETFGTSSERSSALNVVEQYRAGTTATCYVNPARPNEAVLSRDWSWRMLLLGILPVAFMLVGGGGVYFTLRRKPGADGDIVRPFSMKSADELTVVTRTRRAAASSARSIGGGGTGPLVLRPKARPGMKALAALLMSLFWNGIVSIFVVSAIRSWLRGTPDICTSLFMIPFVAIGLFLIGATIHQFLAMFNPVPEITLDSGELALGDSTDVTWRFFGRSERIQRLRLRVEAREEATYRRGTDTVTDRFVFFRQDVADTTRRADIAAGTATLAIPAESMHSFVASNNKIIWELTVHGAISGWPDVKLEFDLNIQPLRPASIPPPTPPASMDEEHGEPATPDARRIDEPPASPAPPEPPSSPPPTTPGELGVPS